MAKTDSKCTAVQMEEKRSKGDQQAHDLEEPFNEDFWLKVRVVVSFDHACRVVCYDLQNMTF